MRRFQDSIFLGILMSASLAGGCQKAPAKRAYHEVVLTASQPAPSVMPKAMPMADDLDFSAIPDDDIHAFLRKGEGVSGMPAMPDDDIHAAVRKGQGGTASGMMPMTAVRLPMAVRSPEGRGAVDQQTQKMLEASVARPPLSWATPRGWQETPGSGMRLVNFTSADKDAPAECTIIFLGGQAGGLESNVARWMKQVNVDVPDAAAMEQFLAAQKKIKTKNGFNATIIDLTQLQPKDDLQSPSMVATIITLPEMTVFVKMTGSRGAVLKNRDKFEALCESLKLN